jgi:peptide/nickel transport system substrate-binding protein
MEHTEKSGWRVRIPATGGKRSRLTFIVMAVALAAIVSVVTVACGSSSKSSQGSASPATTKLTTFTGKAAGDIATLTWGLPNGEPDTVDPRMASYYNSVLVVTNCCDTLTQMTPDGTIVPSIATKWSMPNSRTLVYTIRQGVKFWDGNPLTSADVVYSLDRAAAPAAVVSIFFMNVSSITATGPYQVTIRFKQPDELFQKEMATWVSSVIEKKWGQKVGAAIGTPKGLLMASGPFKLAQWTSGQSITLTRNDSYWNPAYRAHATTVSLKFVTDSTALAEALTSGELDGAWEVPTAILPRLRTSTTGQVHYGLAREYYTINVCRPDSLLAKNPNLAWALYASVDRPALAAKVFNGAAQPCYTYMDINTWDPAAIGLWRAAYQSYVTANASSSQNIAKAKQLVAASSYHGQPLVLITQAGDVTTAEIAQYIQETAKTVGLTVAIRPLQAIQYNQAQTSASARKGYDLMLASSFDASMDPLEPLGFNVLPGSFYNYTDFNNPQVNALVTKARQTFDPLQRTKMLIEVQKIFEASEPATTLEVLDEVSYLNDRLSGLVTSYNYLFAPSLALIGAAH